MHNVRYTILQSHKCNHQPIHNTQFDCQRSVKIIIVGERLNISIGPRELPSVGIHTPGGNPRSFLHYDEKITVCNFRQYEHNTHGEQYFLLTYGITIQLRE